MLFAAVLAVLAGGAVVTAQWQRPVDVTPTDEDIGDGYVTPSVQRHPPRAGWWNVVDGLALAGALALGAWIVLGRRSRNALVALTVVCLLYFGFYRKGCVCPIGAIQNVTVALTDAEYAVPVIVLVFFFLPLLLALALGRVFCGGICPLGAIQDVVLLKPLNVPRRLDKTLGLFKYAYLGLAVWFAAQVAEDRDFVICRYDPFVGFFRMDGPAHILLIGAGLLVIGMFFGRPYCRYICPYGAMLNIVSRYSWRGVSITPDKELDCGLCVEACPFGAIENRRAVRSNCLYCARCYSACPRERTRPEGQDESAAQVTAVN